MTAARTSAQNAAMEALLEAHATELKLPTVKARFRAMATEAPASSRRCALGLRPQTPRRQPAPNASTSGIINNQQQPTRGGATSSVDGGAFYAAYRADGHGRAAHDPAMLVALLLYAYAIGERSSRRGRAPAEVVAGAAK